MNQDPRLENFLKTLSNQRFGRYLALAKMDIDAAVSAYTFNAKISQSFYIPLQGLEVTLRNKINHVLLRDNERFWFDTPNVKLLAHQRSDVDKTKERIQYEKQEEENPVSHDRVVAGLTFGFWVSMFSPKHDDLWRTCLYKIVRADQKRINRKTFSSKLKDIRDIRNRIAHHECILDYDLPSIYENIFLLTSLISMEAASWIKDNSTFEEIYKDKPAYELQRMKA